MNVKLTIYWDKKTLKSLFENGFQNIDEAESNLTSLGSYLLILSRAFLKLHPRGKQEDIIFLSVEYDYPHPQFSDKAILVHVEEFADVIAAVSPFDMETNLKAGLKGLFSSINFREVVFEIIIDAAIPPED